MYCKTLYNWNKMLGTHNRSYCATPSFSLDRCTRFNTSQDLEQDFFFNKQFWIQHCRVQSCSILFFLFWNNQNCKVTALLNVSEHANSLIGQWSLLKTVVNLNGVFSCFKLYLREVFGMFWIKKNTTHSSQFIL